MKLALLLEVSVMNLDARIAADKARRGRMSKAAVDSACAHLKLWKRFQNGGHPTAEELEHQAYLARLEEERRNPPPPKPARRVSPSSVLIGIGNYV